MVRVKERNPKIEKPSKITVDLGVAYDDDLVKPKDF